MKNKILFISPPLSADPSTKFLNHQVPLGFLYMAGILEKKGFIVKILDCPLYYDIRRSVGGMIKIGLLPEQIKKEILDFNPDIVGINCSFTMFEADSFEVVDLVKSINSNIKIVVGGAHVSANTESVLRNKNIDIAVMGEGELTMLEIAQKIRAEVDTQNIKGTAFMINGKMKKNESREHIQNLDALTPAWHLIDFKKYFEHPDSEAVAMRSPSIHLITSRGCPGNCLAGDTIVHTIEGDIPIKDLVGKKEIGVYTYSTKTKEVFITKSNGCHEMGKKELIRVNFDDGTHIDCTPDHKFLTFKQGNQFLKTKEKIKIASNLKVKESVRAIKFYKSSKRCIDINWGHRKTKTQHRMIMEYLIGRKLKYPESIHHINGDPYDNRIENLKLCKDGTDHWKYHRDEASERMKNDNPAYNMTIEWIEKVKKAVTGKKRTYEHRLKYRESKLGIKNPNYKNGLHKHKSRILQINHKVVSIENIGRQMTYDLSVPETHWFFANNVLVHNCVFCSVHTVWGRKWRAISPEKVVEQIEYLYKNHGIRHFRFNDDNLTLDKKRILKICELIKEKKLDIKWDTPSGVALWTLDKEVLLAMKNAGYYRITFGIESGCERTRQYICKNFDMKKVSELIDYCNEIGLWVASFFIIGFPDENAEDIKIASDYIINSKINFPFVFVAQPYAGTRMYNDFVNAGLLSEIKEGSVAGHSKYNSKHFTGDQLNEIRGNIYKQFYKKKALRYLNPIIFYKEFLGKIRSYEDFKYVLTIIKNLVTTFK